MDLPDDNNVDSFDIDIFLGGVNRLFWCIDEIYDLLPSLPDFPFDLPERVPPH